MTYRTKTNKTKKKMSKTDPTKKGGWTRMLAMGKKFLFLIRNVPFYP